MKPSKKPYTAPKIAPVKEIVKPGYTLIITLKKTSPQANHSENRVHKNKQAPQRIPPAKPNFTASNFIILLHH
jgi:hypothetical protein